VEITSKPVLKIETVNKKYMQLILGIIIGIAVTLFIAWYLLRDMGNYKK